MLFLSVVVMQRAPVGSIANPRVKEKMGVSFKSRVTMFRNELNNIDLTPEQRKKWDRVLSQLQTQRNRRDKICHSAFRKVIVPDAEGPKIMPNTAQAHFKSWKNEKSHKLIEMPQRQLVQAVEAMTNLYFDLTMLSLTSLP